MKTTKQSTFSATLRTTILMASLVAFWSSIGALIGGPRRRGIPRLRPADQCGPLLLQRQIGARRSRAKPIDEPKPRASTRSSAN